MYESKQANQPKAVTVDRIIQSQLRAYGVHPGPLSLFLLVYVHTNKWQAKRLVVR